MDSLNPRTEQVTRGYELRMVKSNGVPTLTVAEANTQTQDEDGTEKSVKRYKVGPVGTDSPQQYIAVPDLGKCGLITTHSGEENYMEEGQNGRYLVWNCSELSVDTARRIITRYSGMKAEEYSLKKVIQPNGERRFDIQPLVGAKVIPDQKWKRVGLALLARIRRDIRRRRRTNAKPGPKVLVPMEENFSAMTYNINGLWSKRLEAFLLLEKASPTIVALQETRKTSLSRTTVPRYQSIEGVAKSGGGSRGLLLAVKRDSGFTLSEFEVTDWFVAGRVDGTLQDGSCIRMLVYSIYIPCIGREGRSEAKERLIDSLLKAWCKGNFSQIILLGDFNMNTDELDRFLAKSRMGLQRAKTSEATRIGNGGRETAIDHIVSMGMGNQPCETKVLRWADLSDHLPVMAKWKLPSTPKVTSRLSLDTLEMIKKKGFFLNDERWVTTAGARTVDELADNFTSVCWEITRDNEAVREYKEPKWSHWMSKKTLKIIKARQEMAALRGTALFSKEIYDQLWSESISARKEDSKRISLKKVVTMCEAGRENRFKDLWKNLEQACGNRRSADDGAPLLDKPSGELKFTAHEKGKVWAQHFEALAKDETGNSRTDEYWISILPAVDTEPTRELCDDPLTWTEARAAINAIPNGKAAGIDKIPGELLKLTQEEEAPSSQLGKALWALLEKIWTEAKVPESYRSAIVVPIPKKGDMTDPDNYRGISLIAVCLKVISKIVATRLHLIAERDNLVVKEQAGFRTREECVAQVTTLVEVVKRRSNKGMMTHAIFIDFAKAYDKVPHSGMLRKLESIGIRGHLYKVIRALYEDPRMCVRIGNDLSEQVAYRCGVRQGCPASPILFDLYINDIFKGIEGITVPGILEKLPGLLFADDAVVFAETPQGLADATRKLYEWAIKWEMKINVGKCGIISFPDKSGIVQQHTIEGDPIMIGTEVVPRVDMYTYLGVQIDMNLSREAMISNNVAKGRKTLNSLTKFLCRKEYPSHLKVLLVKAKLIPVLTYGGEIWGMNTQIASKAQKVCDDALRMIVRGGRSTGLKRLRDELGIATIASVAATRRLRALTKFETLRTWIAILLASTAKSKFDTWITGGRRWMRTYVGISVGEEERVDSKRRLLNIFDVRERRKDRTRATARAEDLGLTQSSPWLEMEKLYPELCEMLTEVGRMRIGIFPTGKRLVYQRMLDSDFANSCPICNRPTPESLEHMFFECPSWNISRVSMLVPCFPDWEGMIQSPAAMTLAVGVLLGGERGNGSTIATADGSQGPLPVIAMPVVNKDSREMVVVAARFLAGIIPIRRKLISKRLNNGRRTSSWNQGHRGTVALAEP